MRTIRGVIMRAFTENSIYEIDKENKVIRRTPFYGGRFMPKEGVWEKYFTLHVEVGAPLRVIVEHSDGDEQTLQLRSTSIVTKIED